MAKDPTRLTEETRAAADATAELTANLKARVSAERSLNRELSTQANLASSLNKTLQDNADNLERGSKKAESFGSVLRKNIGKSKSLTAGFSKTLNVMADRLEKSGKKAFFAVGALRALAKGFELVGRATKGIKDLMGKLIRSFIDINKQLILAPLKIVDALMKAADEQAKASIPVAQASEDAAKEFGSNADRIRQMAGAFSDAEGRLGNKFAWMSGDAMRAATQAMSDMGNTADMLWPMIQRAGKEMADFSMAMGFGKEEFTALGNVALATGRDLGKTMRNITQLSYAAAKETGVTRIKIAKDMAVIMDQMEVFGSVGEEQAMVISAKMRSLGMDFKSLGKMIDKFMNFDSAAESAAMLGQAFGMALNPMEMMQGAAGDQVKMLETMRKQFFATGKDVNDLNAAEMKLLMQSTNLSAEEARLMFSMKNRGKSAKSLRNAAKSQMSDVEKQTAAIKSMADEIANLVEVLTTGGMMENFMSGLNKEMTESGTLGAFQDLNEVFFAAGREMGKVLNRLIESGVFDVMVGALMKVQELMRQLGKPGGFFDMIFLGGGEGALQELDKVFQDVFGTSFTDALAWAGSYLVNWAASMIETLANFIGGTLDLAGGTEAQKALAKAFQRLGGAWMQLFSALQPYLIKLMNAVGSAMYDALKGWVEANPGKALAIGALLITLMFGPAFILGAGQAIGRALLSAMSTGVGAASSGIGAIMKRFTPGEVPGGGEDTPTPGGDEGSNATKTLADRIKALAEVNLKDIGKATLVMAGLAVMLGTSGYIFIQAIGFAAKTIQSSGVSTETLLVTFAVMAAATWGTIKLYPAIEKIGKIPLGTLGKAAIGAVALGVLMGILGGAFAGIVALVTAAAGANPEAIAQIMGTMSIIMGQVVMFLPVAAGLGVMLFSVPFGAAGVAIIAAGFGILGSLGLALIQGFVPEIEAIANIKIVDPDVFKKVSDAIIALIDATANFAGVIGDIIDSVKPSPIEAKNGETLAGNIAAVVDLVDAFMKNGLVALVESMTELASLNIGQPQLDAMSAIGNIVGAVGAMAESITNPMASIEADVIDNDEIPEFLAANERFARTAGNVVGKLMKTLQSTFFNAKFFGLLRRMTLSEGQTSMLGDVGPMIAVAVGFMDSLKPGNALKHMRQGSSRGWGGILGSTEGDDPIQFMEGMTIYARKMMPVVKQLIPTIGEMIETLIGAAGAYIADLPEEMDADKINAAAALMSGIMMAVAAGSQSLSQTLQSMGNIMASDMKGPKKRKYIKMLREEGSEMFSRIGDAMAEDLGPALQLLLKGMDEVKMTSTVKEMNAKIEMLGAVMAAMGMAAELFGRGGTLTSVTATQMGEQAATYMRAFGDNILGPSGALQQIASQLDGMTISGDLSNSVENVSLLMEAVSDSFNSISNFTDVASAFDFDLLYTSIGDFNRMIDDIAGMEITSQQTMSNLNTTLTNAGIVKQSAEDIVTMLQGIATITEGIPDITLPIDVMGEAASVIENFQSVADRPISMTVTLNVNLGAEQIATVLKETNAMSSVLNSG